MRRRRIRDTVTEVHRMQNKKDVLSSVPQTARRKARGPLLECAAQHWEGCNKGRHHVKDALVRDRSTRGQCCQSSRKRRMGLRPRRPDYSTPNAWDSRGLAMSSRTVGCKGEHPLSGVKALNARQAHTKVRA